MAASDLPEPVQAFLKALRNNAMQVEGWGDPDENGKCLADTVAHVEVKADGSIVICDNYERFFDTMFTYRSDPAEPDGRWTIRSMLSEAPAREYSFEQALSDASIMFTG